MNSVFGFNDRLNQTGRRSRGATRGQCDDGTMYEGAMKRCSIAVEARLTECEGLTLCEGLTFGMS